MNVLAHFFGRRPRILNALHAVHLIGAATQTKPAELALLARYAARAHVAIEIGSFQGVSSAVIAGAMADDGRLYCVDPWTAEKGRTDPCLSIFRRQIQRMKVDRRIVIMQGTNLEMGDRLPGDVDFMFIDGDHGKDALAFDWSLAKRLVRAGGYVCLHDVLVPPREPWRHLGSADYFEGDIRHDREFMLVDSEHSLAVMQRR